MQNYPINIQDYGRPIARTQSKIENFENPTMKPIDYKTLSSNTVFINPIKVIRVNSVAINGIVKDLIKKCQEIKTTIDNELVN